MAKKISDPEVIADQETWRKLCKEHSDMAPIVEKYREYKQNKATIEDDTAMMDDPDTDKEFKEMLVDEIKTAKENIKVRLEMNKESAAAIQELQALGYTVKYKFYRSEKKARKYKAKLTKSSKVYVNTQGEKGRRYYYKARVMIYDQNGKLVDSSKLTQCRYAARIWTK